MCRYVNNGVIEAMEVGNAIVTISSKNNITYELYVNVLDNSSNIPITDIIIEEDSIKLTKGNTKLISYTVEPVNANTNNLKFSSSDNNVATVSNTGLITAVTEGVAYVYISGNEGIEQNKPERDTE